MLTWEGRLAIQAMALGDVLGDQRLGHAGVDRVGLLPVAVEPDRRELVGPHHPGRDLRDPDRLATQLEPQRLGHHLGAVLGRGVAAPALVGDPAGGRPDVDDEAVAGRTQRGQQRLGDVEGAEHVHVVHRAPVLGIGGGDGVGPEGAAGVVDQHVEGVAHRGRQARDRLGRRHVTGDGPAADLGGQRLDPVRPPRRADHPVAGLGEGAGGGGPDPAAGSGDDGGAWLAHDTESAGPPSGVTQCAVMNLRVLAAAAGVLGGACWVVRWGRRPRRGRPRLGRRRPLGRPGAAGGRARRCRRRTRESAAPSGCG